MPRKSNFQLFTAIFTVLIFGALTVRAELLPIKSYTSADGLIYESVIRIYQDSRGFVWFTTPVGISRFDGYQFTNYGMPEGLFNTLMTDMVEDSSGIYWFGTMSGVIYRFDPRALATPESEDQTASPKRFEDFKLPDSPYINRIYKTARGAIYFATTKGVYLLDDARAGDDKFVPVELESGDNKINVLWLAEDADASLWISSQNGLTRRLADGTLIRYEVLPANGKDLVRAFTIDAKNQLWLVTEDRHLVVFNPEPAGALNKTDKSVRKLRYSPENKLGANLAQGFAYRFTPEESMVDGSFSMPTATRDGKIWLIAQRKGLISFDGREFRLFNKANGLSNNAPSALMEDSFGNLWIGSEWGAMKLSRKGFVSYNIDDGLGSEPINNIFSDRRGTLYAANFDWVINRLDGRKFTSVKLKIPELPDNWLSRKTLLDSAGDWWFATRKGLYRFADVENLEQINERQPTNVYKTEHGLPDNNIYGVFEDSATNVWISSAGARPDSITRWNRQTGEFRVFSRADGIPENCFARHFREDAAGNLYFACSGEFILIFQQEKFTVYATENLPEGWWIGDIHVDRKGRLWVASPTKGLLRIENLASGSPTEKLYSTAEGLSSIHVQFITEDDAGKIYFVTSRGMDVLEPESGKVKQYTLADGLAAAGTGVGLRDKSGDIWLGVNRGLSRFTPEADRQPLPPPVFIGALRIAGKEHPISALGETEISGLTLEPDQSNIQIDFYGLNLTSGDALRYQYRLEGADEDWTTLPPGQRSVNLSYSAGSYKFLVRAVTLEGTTSAAPATVSFTVLRPVWRRWWFLLLLTFLIVGIIYMLYRYRLQKLLEVEKVRTRIATDLHDDIGASLSKIAILSEVVHQRVAPVAPDDAEINEPLEEIAGTSRELVDSMSDIVWAINPERDHLSDLIQRMRNLAGELTEYADIGLRVRLSGIEEGADLPLGADLRREIYLIFKETVNNLVRHSKCEMAEIEFAVEHDFLVITVKDDGRGFVVPANGNGAAGGSTRGGNGLPNMKKRAANLGGSYEITSETGKGTTAVLRVPLQTGFGRGFGLKNLYRKN